MGDRKKNRFLPLYQYDLGAKFFSGKKQIVGTLSRTLGGKKDILSDSNAAEAPPLKVKKVIEQVSPVFVDVTSTVALQYSRRDWLKIWAPPSVPPKIVLLTPYAMHPKTIK